MNARQIHYRRGTSIVLRTKVPGIRCVRFSKSYGPSARGQSERQLACRLQWVDPRAIVRANEFYAFVRSDLTSGQLVLDRVTRNSSALEGGPDDVQAQPPRCDCPAGLDLACSVLKVEFCRSAPITDMDSGAALAGHLHQEPWLRENRGRLEIDLCDVTFAIVL